MSDTIAPARSRHPPGDCPQPPHSVAGGAARGARRLARCRGHRDIPAHVRRFVLRCIKDFRWYDALATQRWRETIGNRRAAA